MLLPLRLNLAVPITVATGRADETDTAQALALAELLATGRSDETDSAFALGLAKLLVLGRADESDSALGLALREEIAPAGADETDTALARALSKLIALGRAGETDLAIAPVFFGHKRADEVDTAFGVGLQKRITTGRSDEIDLAFDLAFAPVLGASTPACVSGVLHARPVVSGVLHARPVVSGVLHARPVVSGTLVLCGGVPLAIDPCLFVFNAAPADNVLDLADLHDDISDVDLNAAVVTLTATDIADDTVVVSGMAMPQVSGNRYRAALAGSLGLTRGQRLDVVVLASQGGIDGRFDARVIVR